jgi:hypothetical protein
MLDKRVKERIKRNKLRQKDWQDADRRKGDKAAIRVIRSRVGRYIETRDAWMIACHSRGFVDIPDTYPSRPNPLHFGNMTTSPEPIWTTPPAIFMASVSRWQRRLLPRYLHVTLDLIMACQKARRGAGVITGINRVIALEKPSVQAS